MDSTSAKTLFTDLIHNTGINLNNDAPDSAQIHDERFYARVLNEGALGLGESYMDGWWDCPVLDELFSKIVHANLENKVKKSKRLLLKIALDKLFNFQTKTRALEVGKKHYDLGYNLFKNMLDSRMNYTCGYWRNASNLEEAQLAKLELTCQKLQLKPGMTLLDIGCGWGGLAKYAAENYGVSVVGITISHDQKLYAEQICAGLPVEIRFQDYRDVQEKFDRICSLGMFEHVGVKNYLTYLKKSHENLKEDGLFLLHTIGNHCGGLPNEWIMKYIFPNGMLPTMRSINQHAEQLFVMEDWHNFGADYDKTLMAWHQNFTNNWDQIKSYYDERFYRMWRYYLLSCAGGFRARNLQLWQVVFSKTGVKGGYQAPRSTQLTQKASQDCAISL